MEPKGFIELEMERLDGEITKQREEILTKSNESMDETNYRPRAFEGLQSRGQHQLNVAEESQVSGFLVEKSNTESPDVSPRGRGKKESGLRSKRGGKALKIHVVSELEETQRRRSHLIAAMADNAPLYPLDLQDHGVDSSQEDESDRSSSLSPEVAANGFGSPIELPSRDSFDELTRELDERHRQRLGNGEILIPLQEIPRSSKVDPAAATDHEREYDEDLLQVSDPGSGPSNRSLTAYVLKTLALILVWYILSTLLTLYNKELLGQKQAHFPAPLLMNTIHFSMQGVISTILVRLYPSMRPSVQMSWKDYFMRVVPTAAATALDVDLTNVSLVFISVTFATMCKSGAPVFILIFAFILKLEVPSYKLLGIILIISSGVMLTVTKATDFNLPGFILVMSAAVMSGFRWSVTQLFLQKEEYGLNNPFAIMSVMTPVMAAISLILSLILEPWKELGKSNYFDTSLHRLSSLALMLVGGTLAFFMVSTEYILLSETSAVTLTIAGVVKEVVTIVVAVLLLKDKFTPLKGLGLFVIILGVSLYNLYKYQKLNERGSITGRISNDVNGNHKYVALKESTAIFELGEEVDDDII